MRQLDETARTLAGQMGQCAAETRLLRRRRPEGTPLTVGTENSRTKGAVAPPARLLVRQARSEVLWPLSPRRDNTCRHHRPLARRVQVVDNRGCRFASHVERDASAREHALQRGGRRED
eukprot:275686-Prymnesium_polylepis.3